MKAWTKKRCPVPTKKRCPVPISQYTAPEKALEITFLVAEVRFGANKGARPL